MKIYQQEQIEEIVAEVKRGAVVAVPTETIYGLAVKFDDMRAIAKLNKIKGGRGNKPYALMLAGVDDIWQFAQKTEFAEGFVKKYLPGELTVVLPKNETWKNEYFDQFDTIGIRVPGAPGEQSLTGWLSELISAVGPLIVTSANRSGEEPALDHSEVANQLPEVDFVVAGAAGGSPPSTVVEVKNDEIKILRQGALKI